MHSVLNVTLSYILHGGHARGGGWVSGSPPCDVAVEVPLGATEAVGQLVVHSRAGVSADAEVVAQAVLLSTWDSSDWPDSGGP